MTTDMIQVQAKNLKALLEASKKEIEAALPKHLTADRMLRIAMTEARKCPALLECTQPSFLGAIIQASQLGLEPGAALGHCWMIPFNNKRAGTKEVQFIIGYRGMIDMAGRAEKVSHVIARAVYQGDKFEFQYGLEESLVHVPSDSADGPLTHVYAVVFLKDGRKIFDVMNVREVEAIRARSKSADSGPWETDYEAMAKKSVVRRLFKYTPVSIELQTAVGMDEAAERGEQNNGAFIETTGRPVTDKAARIMDAVKTEPPKQEPTKEPEPDTDPTSFANATGPIIEPEKPQQRQRGLIVRDCISLLSELGMNAKNLDEKSQEIFKVPLEKTTAEAA